MILDITVLTILIVHCVKSFIHSLRRPRSYRIMSSISSHYEETVISEAIRGSMSVANRVLKNQTGTTLTQCMVGFLHGISEPRPQVLTILTPLEAGCGRRNEQSNVITDSCDAVLLRAHTAQVEAHCLRQNLSLHTLMAIFSPFPLGSKNAELLSNTVISSIRDQNM